MTPEEAAVILELSAFLGGVSSLATLIVTWETCLRGAIVRRWILGAIIDGAVTALLITIIGFSLLLAT